MKKIVFLLSLFCMTSAQAQVDWFGYYEAEADYADMPGGGIFFNYNKLRLDLAAQPNSQISIGATVAAQFFNGKTELNLLDFLPRKYHPVIPGGQRIEYVPYTLADTLFLDNLYLKLTNHYFDLTVGRQQISPGVGYTWNPTDVFNVKNVTDPTYEQTGVDAVRLDIPIQNWTLTAIFQPDMDVKQTTQYYQLKTNTGRFDWSIVWCLAPLRQFETGLIPFESTQSRQMAGFSAEGELFGLGVRTEIALNNPENTDTWKADYIAGVDYTFENSLYILGEYYHSDLGTAPSKTGFADFLSYLSGYRKALNQNYGFLFTLYPVTDLLDAGLLGLVNLDDQSLMCIPQFVYRAYENVEITGMLQLSAGGNDTEFGFQGIGGRLRLRAYF